MTESTPEPTQLELVAQLAAEAATRALPDPGPRITALEASVQEILQALKQAAGPEGNAARLAARLDSAEQRLQLLQDLAETPPPSDPALDDLRLKLADTQRRLAALERTPI